MDALVIQQSFLEGDFLCSNLFPSHVLYGDSHKVALFTQGFTQGCFALCTSFMSFVLGTVPYASEDERKKVDWCPYLDVLWPAHLQPFLLQFGHHGLQSALHGGLRGLGLGRLLLQLGAEALGQGVAALTWERGQVLLRLQQLVL